MTKSAERETINNRVAHYRLVTALATQEARCPPSHSGFSNSGNRINLWSVAKAMHVPVAFATFPGDDGKQTFAAHGFSDFTRVERLATACNQLCSERALVVPDIAMHTTLKSFADMLPKPDIRFVVGISLQNNRRQRVGSLVVINSSKSVAVQGISFKTLIALGKAFEETGRLHADLLADNTAKQLRI